MIDFIAVFLRKKRVVKRPPTRRLSDEGTSYKYNNNQLTKVSALDSGKIVGLKKIK